MTQFKLKKELNAIFPELLVYYSAWTSLNSVHISGQE